VNYYKRHLGDYARDTGHLTALEHGVYTLLLDWYYANEKPLTLDKAIRVAKGNPNETQTVLQEFFKETSKGWIHGYADRIIAEYHVKADHNRTNGKLGGRPKITQTVPEENPNVTLATSHKPEEKKEPKHARTSSSRFADWWAVYPKKRARKACEKKWVAKNFDAMADELIADVQNRIKRDTRWLRGYPVDPHTYLNQERWTDELGDVAPEHNGRPVEPKPSAHSSSAPLVAEQRAHRAKITPEQLAKSKERIAAIAKLGDENGNV
jgi:uncharacterized protein YdaU (DUF1376 family)